MGSLGWAIRNERPARAQKLFTRKAAYLKYTRAARLIRIPTTRASFLPPFVFAFTMTRAQI